MRKSTGNTCAWEQRKLGDFTGKVTEKNTGMSVTETFTNSAEFGVISQLDFFDHAVSKDESISGYTIVCPEDFVYNPRISVTAPVGPINRNRLNRAGVMSPLYTVFRTDGSIDRVYLEHFFKTSGWHSYMQLNGNSGARSDRFSIGDDTFFAMPIPAPSLEEQRQLAGFLESLDTLITLHQREESCAASFSASCFGTLKAFFWEQRKLGDLVQFSKGTGYSKGDLRESGTPIILYGRLYTKYETVISEVDTFADAKAGSVYSRGGEVIVPASGETAEDISIASVVEKSGVLLGGDLNIITPPADLDAPFLAISISNGKPHEDMAKMAQGKSVVHLHNTDLEKIDLTYPSHEEQIQISGYFGALDHLITLHQCKPKSRKGGSHVLYSYQV